VSSTLKLTFGSLFCYSKHFILTSKADNTLHYPLYTALLSDWRVSDSWRLAYLRERTCELDIRAFLHCKDSKICFVRLAYGIAKAGE